MKDIEKIKSEDLACQVQDANPANFAIEQEVAALVGATVPQPTEPSADDARELGAQLLVFLRRALTPIQTALRTAVAAIYAHLDSRCTDYTPAAYAPYRLLPPYDPMRPFVPRTLPNLLTALTAFDGRKISNGSAPNDGIPDGISLARLLYDSNVASAVLKIVDDTIGWTLNKRIEFGSLFPNCKYVELGCKEVNVLYTGSGGQVFEGDAEFHLNNLKKIVPTNSGNGYGFGLFNGNVQAHDIYMPEFEEITGGDNGQRSIGLIRCSQVTNLNKFSLYAPKFRKIGSSYLFSKYNASTLGIERVVLGKIETNNFQPYHVYGGTVSTPYLKDWEFGNGTAVNINLTYWVPDEDTRADEAFLQNFKEHIALRLTDQGSGKTLTLSQAVRDAIHAAEATYGIEAIIVTQKGWTLSPAPGASSQ